MIGSITGSNKISMPMTIVVSGIAKIFVGELVETGNLSQNITHINTSHIKACYDHNIES